MCRQLGAADTGNPENAGGAGSNGKTGDAGDTGDAADLGNGGAAASSGIAGDALSAGISGIGPSNGSAAAATWTSGPQPGPPRAGADRIAIPGRRLPRREEDQEPRWPADRFVGFQFSEEQFPPNQFPSNQFSPNQFSSGKLSGSQVSPEKLSQDQMSPDQCSADVSLSGRRRGADGESMMGTARLATPGTVAAAVPYFFGFHPSDSVVILGLLRSGHSPRAAISQGLRIDLGRIQRNPAGFGRWLARRLTAEGVTEVLCLLYPPEAGPARLGDYRRTIAGFCTPLRLAGVTTLDILLVARGRLWSFLCENAQCCPPDGSPIDYAGSPVAALSAYTGLAIMPSRQALAEALAPHSDEVRGATERECRRALREHPELQPRSEARDRVVLSWAGVMRGWAAADLVAQRISQDALPVAEALTADLAGQLLAALPDVRVRDYVAGWCGGPRAALALDLAIELARRAATDRQRAAGYSVGAWAAWAVGWGAWSQLCLDRALAAMPDYSLAVLIEQGLERGVDPEMVRQAAAGTAIQLADMLADPQS